MKRITIFIGFVFSIIFFLCNCARQDDFPLLKGPYLGQKPPGMTPELFAPGIVTTEFHEHSSPAFSPDGSEVYWSVFINFWGPQVILYMKQENGQWTPPQVAPFSGQYTDGNPFFSQDGKKLFFESERPVKKNGEYPNDIDIWVVDRIENGWGEPKHLGYTINSDYWERGPSVSNNGNLYFSSMRKGGFGQSDIYCSKLTKGLYSEPENLGSSINTDGYESWPFIAPDESFLMFESNSGDILISFRQRDGYWSKPISTAEKIKTRGSQDRFPMVSHDSKYLFFVSSRRIGNPYFEKRLELNEIKERAKNLGNGMGDVYWMDAKIIESLKPDSLK